MVPANGLSLHLLSPSDMSQHGPWVNPLGRASVSGKLYPLLPFVPDETLFHSPESPGMCGVVHITLPTPNTTTSQILVI